MDSDFRFRPPKNLAHFGQISAKFLAEMDSKFFEDLHQKSEFSLLTAAKRIMEKY